MHLPFNFTVTQVCVDSSISKHPPLESILGLDFNEHGKTLYYSIFIHFVTQEEDHTFCSWRDFKDKESRGEKWTSFTQKYGGIWTGS